MIIAAGRGSRPSASVGLPKPLVHVLGVPIIDRVQGRIVETAKNISRWNATDIGVLRCSPKFLVEFDALALTASANSLMSSAASTPTPSTSPPSTRTSPSSASRVSWWVDIDGPEDLATAEHLLVENASKNASDPLANWVQRPVENTMVRHIARRSRITPNQLSVATNVLAYGVTALFASALLLAGSLLSFLVGIADGFRSISGKSPANRGSSISGLKTNAIVACGG